MQESIEHSTKGPRDHAVQPMSTDIAQSDGLVTTKISDIQALNQGSLDTAAKSLFPKIDTNGDGYASESEIESSIHNPKIKNDEAVVLALMAQYRPFIQSRSNDEWGPERSGVTKEDMTRTLDTLTELGNAKYGASLVKEYGPKLFPFLDTAGWRNRDGQGNVTDTGDGFLTMSELNQAKLPKTGDATVDARQAQALETMKNDFEVIKDRSSKDKDKGLTTKDLSRYLDKAKFKDGRTFLEMSEHFRLSWADMNEKHDGLYKDANTLSNSIAPVGTDHIYFLPALASLASTAAGRQQIKNMISEAGTDQNGRPLYTVKFPGAPDRPIQVTAPTDAELSLNSPGSADGYWPAVLQKAFSKLATANPQETGKAGKEQLSNDDFGLQFPSQVLTANGAAILSGAPSTDQLKAIITNGLSQGKPLELLDKVNFGKEKFAVKLAIVGFDQDTNEVTTISTSQRNDHDKYFEDPNTNGMTYKIKLDQLIGIIVDRIGISTETKLIYGR